MASHSPNHPPIPDDDLYRTLAFSDLNQDGTLPRIGLVGDAYTILVSGKQTNGRLCVIDMHIPPGGGPGPHRHDFEETFVLLEGEIEATFRGVKSTVRAGQTINIPSNAPHRFHNVSSRPAHLICICSPAGIEDFFMEVGVPLDARDTPPPQLDQTQMAEFLAKATALAPKYRTELLKEA
ncbi:MAG TPA: cupin domain-containing protein [Terracidiphilus sp.]|jgi:quercetin dioxygenase-like cupin family protein